jgi:hypothetical protein
MTLFGSRVYLVTRVARMLPCGLPWIGPATRPIAARPCPLRQRQFRRVVRS